MQKDFYVFAKSHFTLWSWTLLSHPRLVAGVGESSLGPLHCSVVDVAEGCVDFKVPR